MTLAEDRIIRWQAHSVKLEQRIVETESSLVGKTGVIKKKFESRLVRFQKELAGYRVDIAEAQE